MEFMNLLDRTLNLFGGKITKKDSCIVHIGMPKTGSSSLQASLFKCIDDPSVSYARIAPGGHHSGIMYSLFANSPEQHHYNKHRGLNTNQVERENKKNKELLVREFSNKTTKRYIISGEDIFHLTEPELTRMKTFLTKYFSKIVIVGYVRSPKSFMESAFQQLVKHHDLTSFDFSIIYPHYRAKLEKFDKVFGRENVHLWKFDPLKFPNHDITSDFCSKLGVSIKKDGAVRVNETLSQEAIALLFLDNRYGWKVTKGDGSLISNKLIGLFGPIGATKFRFSNELIVKVLQDNKDDIIWAEERVGERLYDVSNNVDSNIENEDDLCNFALTSYDDLKEILCRYNVNTASFDCNKEDIVTMLFLLKQKLAQEIDSG